MHVHAPKKISGMGLRPSEFQRQSRSLVRSKQLRAFGQAKARAAATQQEDSALMDWSGFCTVQGDVGGGLEGARHVSHDECICMHAGLAKHRPHPSSSPRACNDGRKKKLWTVRQNLCP